MGHKDIYMHDQVVMGLFCFLEVFLKTGVKGTVGLHIDSV